MSPPTLLVISKAPVAGRSKTRLTPPATPEQAAGLAEAALVDTLNAIEATDAAARILVLEGVPGRWMRSGLAVVAQRGDGLDERLEHGFADVHAGLAAFSSAVGPARARVPPPTGPTFLVGMDTPQVTPALLREAVAALEDHDAALGLTDDGGFWGVGFAVPVPGAFAGVPMSLGTTGAMQRERLDALGLRVAELPMLDDIDDIRDARSVAEANPHLGFARTLAEMDLLRPSI